MSEDQTPYQGDPNWRESRSYDHGFSRPLSPEPTQTMLRIEALRAAAQIAAERVRAGGEFKIGDQKADVKAWTKHTADGFLAWLEQK